MPFLSHSCRVYFHPEKAYRNLFGDNLSEVQQEADIIEEDTDGMSVWPLYEQVLHVKFPSLAFIGLNWKVVPFVCFETQVRFALSLMRHPQFLAWDASPNLDEQLSGFDEDPDKNTSGGDAIGALRYPTTKRAMMTSMWNSWKSSLSTTSTREARRRRLKEYHMLGSNQWDYYTRLQRHAHIADAACYRAIDRHSAHQLLSPDDWAKVVSDPAVSRDWTRVREIYEQVSLSRLQRPDTYRMQQYVL